MFYDLSLTFDYEYQTPAGSSRHMLHVIPRDIEGIQRAVATDLLVSPQPAEMSAFLDFFGNKTNDVLVRGDHSVFRIIMRSRLERLSPVRQKVEEFPMALLPGAITAVQSVGPSSPHHFIGRSRLIRPSQQMREFAQGAMSGTVTVSEAVHRVGLAVHAAMTFDATATDVSTSHEEAFSVRRGVCQDFSHIMIACLRSVGIPAGYVSGYIRTIPAPGAEKLTGADAMHAWVRAWCGPNAGWIEYDPTNALHIGDQHVVVAYGRDYSDVSPSKGMLRAFGSHLSSQAVDLMAINGNCS